jgi:uncharacterized membrane protein YgcG
MSMPPFARPPGLAATIWLYASARIAVVALVAGLLVLAGVPLLIAMLVGLIVALPLSMVLFRGLRGRLDEALATSRERRAAERAALRSGLRGDAPDGSATFPDAGTSSAGTSSAGTSSAGTSSAGTSGGGTSDVGISDERPANHDAQPQPDRGER